MFVCCCGAHPRRRRTHAGCKQQLGLANCRVVRAAYSGDVFASDWCALIKYTRAFMGPAALHVYEQAYCRREGGNNEK
jgi:hypothetical protein